MTPEEFEIWVADNGPAELVNGIVKLLPMNNPMHSLLLTNLAMHFGIWCQTSKLGRALSGDVGLYTKPKTGRAIDLAYWSKERLPEITETMLHVAPDLAVEIVSPSNNMGDLLEKVDEYFALGTSLVWIVTPVQQKVYAYTSPRDIRVLEAAREDVLESAEVLPSFTLPLKSLFDVG